MAELAPKRGDAEELLPEEQLLLDAFYRARDEISPLPGVTVDIREVASKAVRAYWEAREQGTGYVDQDMRVTSPMDLPLFRYDVVKAVWARIDPVWEFVRELLSATVPTLTGVALLGIGYTLLTRGVDFPFPALPYLVAAVFAVSAITMTIFFSFRRELFLGSKWRVLQTSAGSLVGGLLVATVASGLVIYSYNQKRQVADYELKVDQYTQAINTYQEEVQLSTAVNEIQPIAASVLSTEETRESLDQLIDSALRRSFLAKQAEIEKIPSESPQKVAYQINYKEGAASSYGPLQVIFSSEKIDIKRQDKLEYTILQSSIQGVRDNQITLSFSNPEWSKHAPIRIPTLALFTNDQEANLNRLAGQKVMMTYDFTLNKPTNVYLLNQPYPSNLYSAEYLPTRIQMVNASKAATVSAALSR